jgi:hypothetical protein
MNPRLLLCAVEPLREITKWCDICSSHPPVLRYEFDEYDDGGESHEREGFCCVRCATELLHKLETCEAKRWRQEEAALKIDEFETTAFHENRLAAFPDSVQ